MTLLRPEILVSTAITQLRRNPPHDKGTPHIRRITPRPNKSGNQNPTTLRDQSPPYGMRLTAFI
ncbi:hypothetical protein [Methyloglobulus morosus]|uniref:hypothetical protein n=1 Tax=Methyloglobulus morosus TaxID=1410681 RepID=UPI00128ECC8C|nr:hypothetical protein [Methyloglobulus morosus]